jgi:hypothetical protein
MTYDGTTIRSYVNGVAGGTIASGTTTCTNAAAGLLIGCGPGVSDTVDTVFFARALSAVEIAQLAAMRMPIIRQGDCFGWYPMFGGANLTEAGIDYSGNGNALSASAAGPSVTNVAPPTPWGGPQALRFLSQSYAVTTAGTTNSTGAAALTSAASLAASGSTQCTGAASMTSSSAIVATGTTQTTGAAVIEDGYSCWDSNDLSLSHTISAWIFPTASQESALFRSGAIGISSGAGGIKLSGTTLNFYGNNGATGATYSYSTAVSLNTWTYVSLVYDATAKTYTSYINAASVDSASFDGTGRSASQVWQFYVNFVGAMRSLLISSGYAMSAAQLSQTMLLRSAGAYFAGLGDELGIFLPFWSSLNSRYMFGCPTRFGLSFVNVFGSGTLDFVAAAPPSVWGGPNTLQYLRVGSTLALDAAGSSQTTGAATVTSSAGLTATGATNVTGAATVTLTQAFQLVATGATNTTGAAASSESASLTAAGSVQTTGTASASSAASLTASGSTQATGAAAATSAAQLTAAGLTQVSGLAQPSGALVTSGLTNVTGSAVVTLTQTFSITASGVSNCSGAAAITITYTLVAAGTTQVTGVAALSIPTPGGGGDGQQTGSERRWLGSTGARRRTRR